VPEAQWDQPRTDAARWLLRRRLNDGMWHSFNRRRKPERRIPSHNMVRFISLPLCARMKKG
jgi:hypothetical protein